MHHYVRAVFYGADQEGCAEGVVYHQRKAVLMGYLRYGVYVRNVAVGVAQGLDVYRLGVGFYGSFHFLKVVYVNECGLYAVERKSVDQQVGGSAVDGLLGHDVLAGLCESLDGIGYGRGSGGYCKSCDSAFERGYAVLEHALGGIGEASVDVARVCKAESVGCVLRVMEYVACGCVDGDGARVACGVRLFLSYVKLKCFEFIVAHCLSPFISLVSYCPVRLPCKQIPGRIILPGNRLKLK